jgi:hypothetical protein
MEMREGVREEKAFASDDPADGRWGEGDSVFLLEHFLDALFPHRWVLPAILADELDDLRQSVGFADRVGSARFLLEGTRVVWIEALEPPAER